MTSKNHLLMSAKNKLSVCAAFLLMSMYFSVASATPIVDDTFDDGASLTNTLGDGSGYTLYQSNTSGTSSVESGGSLTMSATGGPSWVRRNLNTNDRYDFWQYSGSEVVRNQLDIASITGLAGDGIAITFRVVGGGGAALDVDTHPFNGTLPVFQINLRSAPDGSGGAAITGSVLLTNENNQAGSGTFGTRKLSEFTMTQTENFSMVLDVNGDGYSAAIVGAPLSDVTGSMSGLWDDLDLISSGEGGTVGDPFITDEFNNATHNPYTSFSVQRQNLGTGSYEVDRLQVIVIPEPSSLVLLGLGGLLFVAFGKARSKKS